MISLTSSRYLTLGHQSRLGWTLQHLASTCRTRPDHRYQSTASLKVDTDKQIKPFEQIPDPAGSTLENILFIIRNYKLITEQTHLAHRESFKRLGPIFKVKNLGLTLVVTANADAAECVFRAEGKYPKRFDVIPWIQHRNQRNLPLGVLTANDEEWKETRSAVDKRMLRLKDVHSYSKIMNSVIDDFITYLMRLRGINGIENEINGFESETFRWSLETVLGIIFDKRLGCLSDPPDPRGEEFYDAVINMMEITPSLVLMPPYYKYIKTKGWKKYCGYWDTMFQIGSEIIQERKEQLKTLQTSNEEKDSVDFLTDIIQRSNLPEDRLNTTLIEIMLGASDTTANTMAWTLMLLSRHPEKQEKLYQEIKNVLKDGENPDAMTVHNAPYLRACIKETMRLYPVVATLFRQVAEDVVLLDYKVPANTVVLINIYEMMHNEEYFPEPDKFIPERWLKDEDGKITRAGFKFLPFGFGPRMCIGRRIAELEMHLLLTKLVQRFTIGCNNLDDVDAITRMTLTPNKAVKITLTDR